MALKLKTPFLQERKIEKRAKHLTRKELSPCLDSVFAQEISTEQIRPFLWRWRKQLQQLLSYQKSDFPSGLLQGETLIPSRVLFLSSLQV